MGEWKETTLKDVAAIDTGYAFKGDGYTDTGSLRVIRGMNVTIKDVRWGTDAKYWEHGTSGLEKYFLKESDIVIGMDGSRIGENRAMVKAHDLPSILAQRVARVRCIPGVSDQTYLWQVIASENFVAFIKSIFTGTSIPHISQGQLGSYELRLPPLPEQRAIASVLSSLDAKIDLLHRQNKTLEAMAEALFRQWFVEEAEEGWEDGTLGDIIEIHDSKRVPLSNLQRAAMQTGQLYPYYGAATIMDQVNDFLFDGEYILLGEDGTVVTEDGYPVLQYATGKFWVNNHAHVLQAKPPYTNRYLWTYLKKQNIADIVTGAVQPKISQGNLKALPIVLPPKDVVESICEAIAPLYAKLDKNIEQTRTLVALRDTLLPKLMSGGVRVEMNHA